MYLHHNIGHNITLYLIDSSVLKTTTKRLNNFILKFS